MKRLSKSDQQALADHAETMRRLGTELADAVDALNAELETQKAAVEAAGEAYNAAVEAANQFRNEILDRMNDYFDQKSDKWKEGDSGAAYEAWVEQWQTEFEAADLTVPDGMEQPDGAAADAADDLPPEP